MAMPRVLIIIVTWNKETYVLNLLKSLQTLVYPGEFIEMLVVDNASTDNTVESITGLYKDVTVICNKENLGGTGGFNTGLKWAFGQPHGKFDYLWLLDNDVLVDRNALRELVRVMKENPRAAICGSKIMNIDNPGEFIELGAFIDYTFGDVCRNMPDGKELENPQAVFEVDYVAACSLVARTSLVRKLGIWHEKFFIYWDDMEWGARFNAAGYKVLASNASLVYHPSWAGRVADVSAIWRNYYRIRNALWFYNNYATGIRRRFLMARMITRFMRFSATACIRSESELSRAFVRGVEDFFTGNYGKKAFHMPFTDLEQYISRKGQTKLCVFIHDIGITDAAERFVRNLREKYPELRVMAILPKAVQYKWKGLSQKEDMLTYSRNADGGISLTHKYRIMKFLKNKPWEVFLSDPLVPKMGLIWGRDVARVDFNTGVTLASIEGLNLRNLGRIPMNTVFFLIQSLFDLPEKGL